jgi:hypothetical protein
MEVAAPNFDYFYPQRVGHQPPIVGLQRTARPPTRWGARPKKA